MPDPMGEMVSDAPVRFSAPVDSSLSQDVPLTSTARVPPVAKEADPTVSVPVAPEPPGEIVPEIDMPLVMVPVPERVAPELTVTELDASVPLTVSVPVVTEVLPV